MSHLPALARGIEGLVVDVTGVAAQPATRHPPEDLVVGYLDERGEVDSLVALGERLV